MQNQLKSLDMELIYKSNKFYRNLGFDDRNL